MNTNLQTQDYLVVEASSQERASFIRKTYLHVLGAVVALVCIEAALLSMPGIENLIGSMIGSRFSWLIVLGLFMLVSHLANKLAHSDASAAVQYAGLGIFVVAEAIIFLPLIFLTRGIEGAIPTAAVATLVLFAGLSWTVFMTGADFSFLRSALIFGGFVALAVIICGMLFSFTLGPIFMVIMIALMCLWILYDTSNILHHYNPKQHVAASLALFASLATLFWYVLQLVSYLKRED